MGFKMPDAVLFRLSPGEARPCFETEYILGTAFLELTVASPSYRQIREQAAMIKVDQSSSALTICSMGISVPSVRVIRLVCSSSFLTRPSVRT